MPAADVRGALGPSKGPVGEVPSAAATPVPAGMAVPVMPSRDRLGGHTGPTAEISTRGASGTWEPRPELITAMVHRESRGRPGAIGKKGERGMMQVMPATAAIYGVTPDQIAANPALGVQIGTRYYTDLLKRYKGNEWLALVAYNEGPGRVDRGQFLPQSVKYANAILGEAGPRGGGMSPPIQYAQTGGAIAPPAEAPPGGFMERLGGAASAMMGEGTAFAQEAPPPLPPGLRPPELPPGLHPPASAPSAPRPPAHPAFRPELRFGPGGPSMALLPPTPESSQIRAQQAGGEIVLGQVNDAASFYDQNIKPREGEFTYQGSGLGGYWRGLKQPYLATHSLITQPLGGADPQVASFYDKLGPITAAQIHALIGGRVGQWAVTGGPIAPHLPNIESDSLPRIRQKLDDLRKNVPIVLSQIKHLRDQGYSDDDIIRAMGGDPSSIGGAEGGEAEPPPPPGFN